MSGHTRAIAGPSPFEARRRRRAPQGDGSKFMTAYCPGLRFTVGLACGLPTIEARLASDTVSHCVALIVIAPIILAMVSRWGAASWVPAIGASHNSMSRPSERYFVNVLDGRCPATGWNVMVQTATGP